MKKLYKAALAAALGLGAVTAAHAQINNNDLVLGFTSEAAGVTSDYIVDLGQLPSSPDTVMASLDDALFDSTFGSAISGGQVFAGIVGGADVSSPDVFTSVAGGSSAPGVVTRTYLADASGLPGAMLTGVQAQSSQSSWYYNIAENPMTPGSAVNSFAGYLGSNPMATFNGNEEAVILDLYENTAPAIRGNPAGWEYVGNVTVTLAGSTLSAVYDAPEPSTYGLFALGGVLLFTLRRQLNRKNTQPTV